MNFDNLRNSLNSLVADLRAKRVLPLVVLLIAAAVALPLLLSHSGKAASLSPLPPAPTVTAPAPTAATAASGRHEPKQNYLTGPAHNPFVSNAVTGTSTTAAGASPTHSASTSGAPSSGTSTVAARTSTVTATCPNGQQPVVDNGHRFCLICKHAVAALVAGRLACLTPGAACVITDEATYHEYGFSCVNGRLALGSQRTRTTTIAEPLPYSNYEVGATLLQLGVSSTPTVFHNLSRDQLLPSAGNAFLTFLGVRTDLQTAVFILAGDTTVSGEGRCAPSAATCTFLTLLPGQAAKIVVTPSGSSPETFAFRYVKLRKVSSNASVVTVDPAGAADVTSAESYLPQLKTVGYEPHTGLLTIELGSTVPVTP